ncbi:glutamate racemase [Lichenicoccus roseus]|uniref:glutamate racemase n=1 Tax=Lichenicoccus roseus TaxID=2683649 RepID=UPI001F10CB65|nr:aspartate/glutamate racemase family protein [Lichenicoccus roseus]
MTRILAFDSGIGGYGIVGALRTRLPRADITMLSDNEVYPYGEIPDTALVARIERVIGAGLDAVRPDVVVIACNTASTVALDALRGRFAIPFVGTVPPVKWAASLSRTRHIGLLATAATVRRPYLHDLAARFAADCTLLAHGARGLADLAEAAFRGRPVPQDAIRHELAALFGQPGGGRIDVVCIGCTHYSFLLDALRAASPDGILWLDPAEAVARRTADVLAQLGLDDTGNGAGVALFTAPPADPEALRCGLPGFGYPDFSLLEIAETGIPAGTGYRPRLTV